MARYKSTERILNLIDSITVRRQTKAELSQDYDCSRTLDRDLEFLLDKGYIYKDNQNLMKITQYRINKAKRLVLI